MKQGWIWGGGGHSPQGFDPLPTQRVPLLYYFEISRFGDGSSNFLKAPPLAWREGRARAKKTPVFQKIVGLFFKILPAALKILQKEGIVCALVGRARKINSVDLKKRSTKLSTFFENPPPTFRENPRSAPDMKDQFTMHGLNQVGA